MENTRGLCPRRLASPCRAPWPEVYRHVWTPFLLPLLRDGDLTTDPGEAHGQNALCQKTTLHFKPFWKMSTVFKRWPGLPPQPHPSPVSSNTKKNSCGVSVPYTDSSPLTAWPPWPSQRPVTIAVGILVQKLEQMWSLRSCSHWKPLVCCPVPEITVKILPSSFFDICCGNYSRHSHRMRCFLQLLQSFDH